jgi:hypothetical protein
VVRWESPDVSEECHFHLHGRRVSQERNRHEIGSKQRKPDVERTEERNVHSHRFEKLRFNTVRIVTFKCWWRSVLVADALPFAGRGCDARGDLKYTYFGRMQQHLVQTGRANDSTETESMPGSLSSAGKRCYSIV